MQKNDAANAMSQLPSSDTVLHELQELILDDLLSTTFSWIIVFLKSNTRKIHT